MGKRNRSPEGHAYLAFESRADDDRMVDSFSNPIPRRQKRIDAVILAHDVILFSNSRLKTNFIHLQRNVRLRNTDSIYKGLPRS